MPPRPPPAAGARGRGRGAPPPRGGAPRGGGGPRGGGPPRFTISDHVQTIGVRKPEYGREGRPFQVFTNHFAASVTDQTISHYDGMSCPSPCCPNRSLKHPLYYFLFNVVGMYLYHTAIAIHISHSVVQLSPRPRRHSRPALTSTS